MVMQSLILEVNQDGALRRFLRWRAIEHTQWVVHCSIFSLVWSGVLGSFALLSALLVLGQRWRHSIVLTVWRGLFYELIGRGLSLLWCCLVRLRMKAKETYWVLLSLTHHLNVARAVFTKLFPTLVILAHSCFCVIAVWIWCLELGHTELIGLRLG